MPRTCDFCQQPYEGDPLVNIMQRPSNPRLACSTMWGGPCCAERYGLKTDDQAALWCEAQNPPLIWEG